MDLVEFYDIAKEIAEQHGYKEPKIVVMSGCYEGRIRHTCQLWDMAKGKHVYSEQHTSPKSALEAFNDNLIHHKKEYPTDIQSIKL